MLLTNYGTGKDESYYGHLESAWASMRVRLVMILVVCKSSSLSLFVKKHLTPPTVSQSHVVIMVFMLTSRSTLFH